MDATALSFPFDEWNRSASLALADSGRLLVAWTGPKQTISPEVDIRPLLAQVWQARHNADPCIVRDGRFLCDTAGDGGAAEASIAFGQPGDIPLLGDWDGDSRADTCVYRAGHCWATWMRFDEMRSQSIALRSSVVRPACLRRLPTSPRCQIPEPSAASLFRRTSSASDGVSG